MTRPSGKLPPAREREARADRAASESAADVEAFDAAMLEALDLAPEDRRSGTMRCAEPATPPPDVSGARALILDDEDDGPLKARGQHDASPEAGDAFHEATEQTNTRPPSMVDDVLYDHDDDDGPITERFVLPSGDLAISSSHDRRYGRRIDFRVPVRLSLGDSVFDGVSEDLSATGMFVETPRLIPAGRRVQVRFDLPHGTMLLVAVVIRFRTPNMDRRAGVALVFEALTEGQEACIQAFCDANPEARY